MSRDPQRTGQDRANKTFSPITTSSDMRPNLGEVIALGCTTCRGSLEDAPPRAVTCKRCMRLWAHELETLLSADEILDGGLLR
jgi:hypothetical protein